MINILYILCPLLLISCTSIIKTREELEDKHTRGFTKLQENFFYYGYKGKYDLFKLKGEIIKIPFSYTQFGYPIVYPDMRFEFKSFKQDNAIAFTGYPYERSKNGTKYIFVPKSDIITTSEPVSPFWIQKPSATPK